MTLYLLLDFAASVLPSRRERRGKIRKNKSRIPENAIKILVLIVLTDHWKRHIAAGKVMCFGLTLPTVIKKVLFG